MLSDNVYIIQMGKYFKIGVSKDSKKRLSYIDGTLLPEKPYLIYELKNKEAYIKELQLHEEYKLYRVRGEWFDFDKKTLLELVSKHEFIKIKNPIFNFDDENKIDRRLKTYFKKEAIENKRLKKEFVDYKKKFYTKVEKPFIDYMLYMFKKRIRKEDLNIFDMSKEITIEIKTDQGEYSILYKNE